MSYQEMFGEELDEANSAFDKLRGIVATDMLKSGCKIEDLYFRIVHGVSALIHRPSLVGYYLKMEHEFSDEGCSISFVAEPHQFTERELVYPPSD